MKKRRTGPSKGVSRAQGKFSYTTRVGPVLAPKMPREFSISSNNFVITPYSSVTGVQTQIIGLCEYLDNTPDYVSQLYSLYKYSRVTAVQIHATIVNLTGSTTLETAMGIIPYNENPVSPSATVSTRAAIYRTTSSMGGQDRSTLSKTYIVDDWIGNLSASKYWITSSQAASSTPIDVIEPAIKIVSTSTPATTWSAVLTIRIVYHVQMFDLIEV